MQPPKAFPLFKNHPTQKEGNTLHKQTMLTSFGSLLHDVGKMVYRAKLLTGSHSARGAAWLAPILNKGDASQADLQVILDCVRYHHGRELSAASLPNDSPAYITYLADNLSSAADRREQEGEASGFLPKQPLVPVFRHLNGEHAGFVLKGISQDGSLVMPVPEDYKLSDGDYNQLLESLKADLKNLSMGEPWLNSLLCSLESHTSTVPSSTNQEESPDISLFDHTKTTAAIGSCISEWLLDNSVTNYRKCLLREEKQFCEKNVFLLYSADFSGIQKFIYTVSTQNALRSLRSRSFFLELAMEHYIDEALGLCGVSRANLLYSGGGHCYLLLPNTQGVKTALTQWNTRFNEWLMDTFGISLYLAHGWAECSGYDLTAKTAKGGDYQGIFRRVSSAIAKAKLHRYTPAQMLRLNRSKPDSEGRECRICGRTDTLTKDKDGDTSVCRWCQVFESLSIKIQKESVYVVTSTKGDFTLPSAAGTVNFLLTNEKQARTLLQSGEPVMRIYTKNRAYTGLNYSTRIYIGDYAASNELEELAKSSQGIARLGVCRMDVDNLGQAFVSGFMKGEDKKDATFNTISRTSAFSRQLSLFFKRYINDLLDGTYQEPALSVSIVYSGGDDVFLVGAWNDVLEGASRIRSAFRQFTCNSLTISGGVALFPSHHPIRLAASKTAELEDTSKNLPNKDGITLFAPEEQYCFPWDEFQQKVKREKLFTLNDFFQNQEDDTEEEANRRGNSFLYRLTDLLRGYEDGKTINLARYAYTLARMEPKKDSPQWSRYDKFSKKMYQWIAKPSDRKELISAIYIHVYQQRKRKES
jgi:CRISPR-associated protein Csm1